MKDQKIPLYLNFMTPYGSCDVSRMFFGPAGTILTDDSTFSRPVIGQFSPVLRSDWLIQKTRLQIAAAGGR